MQPDEQFTEETSSERALARTRERYHLLVQSVTEYAMFTMDTAGVIDSWNTGAERILGYTEQEAQGLPGSIIFIPEDLADGAFEWELTKAREEGQAMDERWHVRQDGSRFWGSGAVTSLWEDGTLRGYAKVMRDNTERKQAREALQKSEERYRELAATLEQRVEQRTAQVRALASELVTSEQTVRQRLARTLHDDLQQMLYAAEMQIHFLRQKVDSPPELEELARMIDESLRLTRQLTVELSPPVLKEQGLGESLEWLAHHMKQMYQLQVEVESEQEQWVAGEEQRMLLFETVRELLFNVVKHADVKKARVTIEQTGGSIVVTVSDQGKGFNADVVMNKKTNGFGLRNVRERLELFGGQMDIASTPGAGSRVTLRLPALEDAAGENSSQQVA